MIRIIKVNMTPLNYPITRLATSSLLAIIFSSLPIIAQGNFDGPYIFHEEENLKIQYILDGAPIDTIISKDDATTFDVEGLPVVDLKDLDRTYEYKGSYTGVEKIFALSDIHGQYDLMVDLLRGNNIITDEGHWSFGEGHLVITGDNFDRGDKVMEVLWFFYKLEREAEKAGGKVHVLLGNHESMVLNNDLRYLNRKYLYTSGALRTRYDQLFKPGSVLGDWLTNHNVTTSINGHLFVHGGISTELIEEYPSIDDINKEFVKYLIKREGIPTDEKLQTLVLEKGPIWYRGYFDADVVNDAIITDILSSLDQEIIVVGHTSLDEISTFFDGKVIGIDCSIKLGESAAGLLIDPEGYFSCDQDGDRRRLDVAGQSGTKTLFDHLYDSDDIPTIDITTNVKRLINKSSKEEYEPSVSTITYGENSFQLPTRVRARGNVRKEVCSNPPLKLDFKAGQLDSMGYDKGSDKLKLVIPCDGRSLAQTKLYDEYFLYGLYQIIEPRGIRAKLAKVILRDENEVKKDVVGFLVEDEEQYSIEHDAKVIEKGIITEFAINRECFLKMCFFQYMISNTDWSISSKHNVELVKLPDEKQVIALPYDFDYSGFVGQNYAVPHGSLPIKTVYERHFMAKMISDKEITETAAYFLELEAEFHDYIDAAPFWDDKRKKRHHQHIDGFYKLLKKPKSLKRALKN